MHKFTHASSNGTRWRWRWLLRVYCILTSHIYARLYSARGLHSSGTCVVYTYYIYIHLVFNFPNDFRAIRTGYAQCGAVCLYYTQYSWFGTCIMLRHHKTLESHLRTTAERAVSTAKSDVASRDVRRCSHTECLRPRHRRTSLRIRDPPSNKAPKSCGIWKCAHGT